MWFKFSNLPQSVTTLESVTEFLKDFWENGLVSSIVKANELAEELGVERSSKTYFHVGPMLNLTGLT